MKLKAFDHMNCSLAQTLDVIGERWTLLIVRDAFFGIRRFDQFQRNLGIARNILATRLSQLVDEGILERRPTDDSRHEYVLTDKGLDLHPVLLAMIQSFGISFALEGMPGGIVASPGIAFKLMTILTLTTGTGASGEMRSACPQK